MPTFGCWICLLAAAAGLCASTPDWHRIAWSDSLGLYCGGQRVGSMVDGIRVTDSSYPIVEYAHVQASNWMDTRGGSDRFELEERRYYDWEGNLDSAIQTIQSAAGANTWRLRRSGEEWVLNVNAGGAEKARRVHNVSGTLRTTYELYRRMFASRIKVGDTWTDTSFNMTSATPIVTTTRCEGVPSEANGGQWEFAVGDDLSQTTERWVVSRAGRTVLREVPPAFVARREPPEEPGAASGATPDYEVVRELFKVEAASPPSPGQTLALLPDQPEMLHESVHDFYTRDGEAWILRERSRGEVKELSVAEVVDHQHPWTKATVTIQSEHPRIIELAKQAGGEERNVGALVSVLNKWVFDHITKRSTATFSSALETLNAGFGDCGEHAALLTALLRARGIPARIFLGLVYVKSEGGYLYHAWTGVHADGAWVFADPAFGRFPVHGGLVPLVVDDTGENALFLSRLIGRVRIEHR